MCVVLDIFSCVSAAYRSQRGHGMVRVVYQQCDVREWSCILRRYRLQLSISGAVIVSHDCHPASTVGPHGVPLHVIRWSPVEVVQCGSFVHRVFQMRPSIAESKGSVICS